MLVPWRPAREVASPRMVAARRRAPEKDAGPEERTRSATDQWEGVDLGEPQRGDGR